MKRTLYVTIALLALLTAGAALAWHYYQPDNPDVLRRIVLQQCLPNQLHNNEPAPCAQVNLAEGYAVLKDRNGPLQYLLLPAYRVNGIESPLLLEARTPNFFWHAWQARRFMSEKRGAKVADEAVSLTLNSRLGRTQNHLHIHISCLRTDVRARLNENINRVSSQWQPFPGGLRGNHYLARRVSAPELSRRSPFMMLAEEVPQARDHMGRYALALAKQNDGSFILLATARDLLHLNLASAEELQDHDCAILNSQGESQPLPGGAGV